MNKKLILIPDIHGREFWKDAAEFIGSDIPVIFLGDYLDPYPHEHIGNKKAIDNFKEILDTTKNKDNVTLLLGNHDCTYIWPEDGICECRTDYTNFPMIQRIFQDNLERLKLCTEKEGFIISHAGIHQNWLDFVGIKKENILERQIDRIDHKIIESLGVVSWYRGGIDNYGSPVWADIREFQYYQGQNQICGHTQQYEKPLRIGDVVCLDCRACFYVDEEGDIRWLKDDKVVE